MICDWWISRSVLCVSVFEGALLVILLVIMIDCKTVVFFFLKISKEIGKGVA